MCGRYASFLPAEFIARLFASVNPLPNLAPTWNMAPTMDAPVVRLIDGDRHLDALKWGFGFAAISRRHSKFSGCSSRHSS
jgi:putative SOS response-associated peptidase YedK